MNKLCCYLALTVYATILILMRYYPFGDYGTGDEPKTSCFMQTRFHIVKNPEVITLEVLMTLLQIDTPGFKQNLLTSLQFTKTTTGVSQTFFITLLLYIHFIRCKSFRKSENFTSVNSFTKLNKSVQNLTDSTSQGHKGKICSKALPQIERMRSKKASLICVKLIYTVQNYTRRKRQRNAAIGLSNGT